jgi:spermidine/putrescine transport system permease protein
LIFKTGYLEIYGRSFLLAIYSTVAALIIGFPSAYFMATRPPENRNMWVFLFTLPFWTNLLIRTYALMIIIRDEGLVNITLERLGIIDQPLVILYTDFAVGLGLLSKQTMAAFFPLAGIFLLLGRDDRRELARPAIWIAALRCKGDEAGMR